MTKMISDNLDAFAAWEFEQAREAERLPHCDICGEPLDYELFVIDGRVLCLDCVRWKYGDKVDDFLERG